MWQFLSGVQEKGFPDFGLYESIYGAIMPQRRNFGVNIPAALLQRRGGP